MTTKIVKIPMYNGKLRIDIVDSMIESKHFVEAALTDGTREEDLEREGTRYNAATSHHYDENSRTQFHHMIFARDVGTAVSTIAHEALHCSYNILSKQSGWTPDPYNHEPHAYLIGWLVAEADKVIRLDEKKQIEAGK